jgi:hypothetical protein
MDLTLRPYRGSRTPEPHGCRLFCSADRLFCTWNLPMFQSAAEMREWARNCPFSRHLERMRVPKRGGGPDLERTQGRSSSGWNIGMFQTQPSRSGRHIAVADVAGRLFCIGAADVAVRHAFYPNQHQQFAHDAGRLHAG